MRYFDKLLNFFSSSYSNNTRFHHSTLGYLKIFFERNNKLKSTFTSLGNVFRNSKWSDLKIQNIKTSFIKSWSSYFIAIVISSSLILSLFGTYSGNTILSQIPFLGDIYEILCFSWTQTEDFLKAFLLSTASTYSYFKTTLHQNTYTRQNYVYESLSSGPRLSVPASSTFKLANDEIKNHAPIEMMYKLAHASKSIQYVDTPSTVKIEGARYGFSSLNVSDYIDYTNLKLKKNANLLPISDIEQSYATISQDASFIQQFDTESSNLNKVSSYNVALAATNFNTQDALRTAKQDRWLVRNSLLSENLIINSNAFTQSKKLLGVNFLNSDAASKNVWNSSKLTSLDNNTGTSFISNLQELFNSQPLTSGSTNQLNFTSPNLDNFNFFENSRMWLVKKYFFTNQLKNNLTQASLTAIDGTKTTTIKDNTYNYTLFLNLYNQNPQNQLSFLTMSIRPVNTENNTSSLVSIYDFYVNAGDADVLKANNLSFLNKLTHSTSNEGLKYYTTLTPIGFVYTNPQTLNFKK